MSDKYNYATRPENERLFSTAEVAEAAGVHPATINALARDNGVLYSIMKIDGKRRARYTYEAMRQLVELASVDHKQRKTLQYGDDEASEHPLVTDKRLLKLSYFPDVTPECFSEGE